MDSARFDALTKSVASTRSRRRMLAGLAGSALGALGFGSADARTCSVPGTICREHATCCSGRCGPKDRTGRRRCQCRSVADCPPPPAGTPCVAATCVDGACRTSVLANTPCDDGNACTRNDVCQPNGTCAGVNTPVDCVVSAWSDFSTCSAACGGGTQTRTRSIVTPVSCGGQGCPETTETQSCNAHACGTCDATQAAAFCSTVTAVDGTQHCGRPGFGPLCCDADADCATNGLTCGQVVPTFCAKTLQIGTGTPSPLTCAADSSKAGLCSCLAVCDLPT